MPENRLQECSIVWCRLAWSSWSRFLSRATITWPSACGWICTSERTNRVLLGHLPLSTRRRTHGVRPPGFEPRNLPRIRRVRLADHRSAAIPDYATAAWLTLLASWRTALRRGRVVVRPSDSSAAHRDRPARIRTGDPWSKARWDCCFPTGLWSPRPDSNGDPLAQDEVRFRLRHGAVTTAYERTRTGERQGMASPTGRIPKPKRHPGTRVSVWRRHYLRVMPLAAVGTRYVPMGSTMPCASCACSLRRRGIWEFRPGGREPARRRACEESNKPGLNAHRRIYSPACCRANFPPRTRARPLNRLGTRHGLFRSVRGDAGHPVGTQRTAAICTCRRGSRTRIRRIAGARTPPCRRTQSA